MRDLKLHWRAALETAVTRLAAQPEHQRMLCVFVDHWGLEFYTPPPEVEESVRNIVAGMLACARAVNADDADNG
jgi:hypothetical protein